MRKKIDMLGTKWGELTVISEVEAQSGRRMFLCKCSCGREKIIRGSHLRYGAIKTCRKCNEVIYEVRGDITVGKLTNGHQFTIDSRFYNKVSKHQWCINLGGYFFTRIKGRPISLHRYIANITDKNIYIDHINRIKSDNRISNLRIATRSENSFNVDVREGCTSKFKGVSWNKRDKKWQAEICYKRSKIFIGRYHSEEDAAGVYNFAAFLLVPDFAVYNDVPEIPSDLKEYVYMRCEKYISKEKEIAI